MVNRRESVQFQYFDSASMGGMPDEKQTESTERKVASRNFGVRHEPRATAKLKHLYLCVRRAPCMRRVECVDGIRM